MATLHNEFITPLIENSEYIKPFLNGEFTIRNISKEGVIHAIYDYISHGHCEESAVSNVDIILGAMKEGSKNVKS
jgi:hypothetical protein